MIETSIKIKPNKSLTYILPVLDSKLKFEYKELILNTYISKDGEDKCFHVLYKWCGNPNFIKYEGRLMKEELAIGHEDFGEHVLYSFKLTPSMMNQSDLFVKGKYKEFSKEHKEDILSYLREKGVSNIDNIEKILDANHEKKSEPPEMEDEIFKKHLKVLNYNMEKFEYEGN